MADVMRWRYGALNSVVLPVLENEVVEIGDLLFMWDRCAYAASQIGLLGSRQPTRDFVTHFVGVAMQRSQKGIVDQIEIATTGVFEFSCEAASFTLGRFIGPCSNSMHTGGIYNQLVSEVNDVRDAIGRVAQQEISPVNHVLVSICSSVMTGGVFERRDLFKEI